MVHILKSDSELRTVLDDVEKQGPRAQQFAALIRNTLSEIYAWPGIEYVVDRYPDWQAIICRPIKDSPIYRTRAIERNVVNVFTKNREALVKFLDQPDVIDWSQACHFMAVPSPDEYEVARQRSVQLNPVLVRDGDSDARVFIFRPDTLVEREMPAGPFALGQLRGHQHAALVQANWEYSTADSRHYFEYLLHSDACRLPNSAIFDTTTNTPVAYLLYAGDGSMGTGWVHPDYRNRGLYHVVAYHLCQKIFRMGHPGVFAFVSDGNEASRRSFVRLGGEECDFRVEWLTSGPALV